MQETAPFVDFDRHGLFVIDDSAVMIIPDADCSAVFGGTDVVCQNDGVCGGQLNFIFCVNAGCGHTLSNAACFDNGVCVSPLG